MKIMFTVQGEGRGHMTQAIAVSQMLKNRGHRVVAVLSGGNLNRSLPSFFQNAFDVPVRRMASPSFALKNNRGISGLGTLLEFLGNARAHAASLRLIRETIEEHDPDLIINFLEPLMGVFNLLNRRHAPTLAVGHQFMMNYPGYVRTSRFRGQRIGTGLYFQLVAARSSKLAISFYRADNLPRKRLTVCPPMLRRELFTLEPERGDRLLVYLAFHGFRSDILEWHKQNPNIPIDCFNDKPGAPEEESPSKNLTFHRLDGEKFLRKMANCRAVVSTAGVESVCEAAYLGKPLLMVPVENHLEQFLNAKDAERSGLGIADKRFNLSRVIDPYLKAAGQDFRQWVDETEPIVMRAIEEAAAGRRARQTEIHSTEQEVLAK